MDILMGHVGHGIWLILLLSLPVVLLAAGIGLVVGILQAVTQVQEQTIAAAPKITFVFLLVIFGGPLMVQILQEYLVESMHLGFEVVAHDEARVLPPKPRMAYGEANSRLDFFKEKRRIPTDSKVKAMMNQPSKAGSMDEAHRHLVDQSSRVQPKPGIGEKIYMKRRDAGTLPKPPDRRQ